MRKSRILLVTIKKMDLIEDFFGDWVKVIDKSSLIDTLNTLDREKEHFRICPEQQNVFRAFLECSYSSLQVVFLGQDPYPQKGVATGILFGNFPDTPPEKYSPSLRVFINSIDKYYNDLPMGDTTPDLTYLSRQGVLMINSALTVRENEVGSHTMLWRKFISSLLHNISIDKPETIFVLFGNQAQTFIPYIQSSNIIKCPHPAYCARREELLPDIFSSVDERMKQLGKPLIFWE